MNPLLGFLLVVTAFVAGISTSKVEFPVELREAAQRARCDQIQQDIYMAVDDEVESVTALTPLEDLCDYSRHLQRPNAWISCVEYNLNCQ